MGYDLWEVSTANMIAVYATEAEALFLVEDTAEQYGDEAVATWALGYENKRGRSRAIASGTALLERARANRERQ